MITKRIKQNNIDYSSLVDMHIHTNYSPDSMMTLEQTLIELQGFVNAITITDHNIISFVPDLILNSYEEKYQIKTFTSSVEISSIFGDILAYGIDSVPSTNLHPKEIIDIIHSEGGIVAAAHPFDPLGLGDKIYELDLDAIEINGSRFRDANAIAKEAAESMGLPCIG